MNIVTLIDTFVSTLLQAEQGFIEHPDHAGRFEEAVVEASHKAAADFMAMVFEGTDELIRGSRPRKDRYNILRKRKRTLITTAGDVTYERTVFQDRETGKTSILLDEMMHLPKHERFSVNAEAKVLNEAEVHSYQHAADSLKIGGQTVSKTAVMEKIHAITEDIPEEKTPSQKKCCEYIYIEADEDHIHRQKCGEERGCMIGKLIYIFEGKEDLCNGRRKLIDPHYYGGLYPGTNENRRLWEDVQKYIEEHYDTDFLKAVYICSDGGSWIKAGKEYVDRSVLVADKFHLMKYINSVANLTGDAVNDTKARFYKYIYTDKLLATCKMLTRIKTRTGKENTIENARTYFINNWEAIQRTFHDKNVLGCSAEGHVSSVFSERMSSRPMGWSETGSDRMCKLRCYVRNCGRDKIVDLVEYRRELQCGCYDATGTEGMIVPKPKKYYSAARRESMRYAEAMYAPLFGRTVKKTLAIREHLYDI